MKTMKNAKLDKTTGTFSFDHHEHTFECPVAAELLSTLEKFKAIIDNLEGILQMSGSNVQIGSVNRRTGDVEFF